MAQKQFTFDFILNAVVNGGFSGAFTKAQQEFMRLGNEIKNLQAIQRDVKSYEKQAAAVQNTSQKLENLKRQYALVKQQISETTGSTTALEREKLKLEQRIANTEAALEKQKQRLGETTERLDAAGVSTDNLAGKDEELRKKIEELTQEQKKVTEGAGDFQSAGIQAIEAVGGAIAAAGIAEAMKNIAEAYRECVDVAACFEQAMSAVEAIADASSTEMAALTAEAKELGATTKFTAQQSANAMEYMAMAGWDAQEMLGGMNGVINLAAAAGEDLAQVSDIVTDNLSAFGLRAADTAHFADVLASAAANSNTNISIMGETFKSSSSVAGALGYSIEDVAVMVGLMANNAVKGSRAGTALRNIFNGLLKGVTLTSSAFGDLEYSAINSDGSMKGLMETVRDLRGYFSQMTEAERVNNAMAIAGMRGYNGLLAILRATDEDFQNLYASVNDCTGAAERMAKVKLDNLNGDITIMNSAMEALQSTVGEQFNPELRELTQLGTELLNGANSFIKENPALVKGVMAGTGAFLTLGTAVVGVNAAIQAFKALGLASLFTSGPTLAILGVAGGIAAIAGYVTAYREEATKMQREVDELTTSARGMNQVIEDAGTAYDDTAAAAQAASEVAKGYVEKLQAIEATGMKTDEQQREYQNTLALLLQTMPELSSCISQTADEYGRTTYALEGSTSALYQNIEAIKENAMAQAMQERMTKVFGEYSDVLIEAQKNSIGLTDAKGRLSTANKKYSDTLKEMTALEESARKEYEHFDTVIYPDRYYELKDALAEACNEVQQATDDVQKYEQALEDGNETIADAEEEIALLEKAVRQTSGPLQQAVEDAGGMAEALDSVRSAAENLAKAYQETYEAAQESIRGQYSLWDELPEVAATSVSDITKQLQAHQKYWDDYGKNLDMILSHAGEFDGLSQMVSDLAGDFSETSVNIAAGLAEALEAGDAVKLKKLIEMWYSYQDAMTDTATKVTEIAEDMPGQLAGLQSAIEQAVKDMDQSEDAYDIAFEIAQAFAAGASDQAPAIRAAYEDIAVQAINALMKTSYKKMSDYTNAKIASSIINMPGMNGYASGTDSAPPGWAWVGEEGPELMRMHGGEQILSAPEAARAAAEYEVYRETIRDITELRPGSWTNVPAVLALPAYAVGTENAAPGWARVGEEGPELMRIRGGEQVLPNGVLQEVTRDRRAFNQYSVEYQAASAVQSKQESARPTLEIVPGVATGGTSKIEMHFHIEAGASPETVDAWQDYVRRGELETLFRDMSERQSADMRRRALV